MAIKHAIIPVAGYGTRLLPLTKTTPKALLPVGRKPVLQHIVAELAASGVEHIHFITNPDESMIEDHFKPKQELNEHIKASGRSEILASINLEALGLSYSSSPQHERLGLGHAVLQGHSFAAQENIVVALGDALIGLPGQSSLVQRMARVFEKENADIVIAFQNVEKNDVTKYGIAKPKAGTDINGMFVLEDVIEKPTVEATPSTLAIAARYIFSPAIFDFLANLEPGKDGELQLTDAIRLMLKSGAKGYGVRLNAEEQRYDMGNFRNYYRTFTEFALADDDNAADLLDYLQDVIALKKAKHER